MRDTDRGPGTLIGPGMRPLDFVSRFDAHPLRQALYEEVHARPPPLLWPPVRASHMIFLADGPTLDASFDHVCDLARRYSVNLPDPEKGCFYQAIGGFELRWERHTEFCSYTFLRPGVSDPLFSATGLDVVPRDWLEGIPGLFLFGNHLAMCTGSRPDPFGADLAGVFEHQTLFGSRIVDERAAVFTTLRLHSDGFGRMLVCSADLSPFQAGRTLQRLLEMETYRIMSLLALPEARRIASPAARLDSRLVDIMDEFSSAKDTVDERRLLDELTELAAQVEHFRSATNQRFAATRAYDSLVRRRLADIREIKFPGMSTIGKFLERRLAPAMRTCQAVEDMLESLSRRIDRATDLLQARVDVAIESQNQQVLSQMNRRGRLQLRLQQTVEGLSVAAISYYTVGLIKYALEAMESGGIGVEPTVATGVSVPIVILVIWWLVRRIRRRLETSGAPGD
jgi:uncharacterized membrane-anchored protein